MLGYRWKHSIQQFELTLITNVSEIADALENGAFKLTPFTKSSGFWLRERGKWRWIMPHTIRDRVVLKSWTQHSFMPQIQGRIMNSNCASQKGKGTDYSIKLFRQHLRKATRLYGNDFYVVTCDIHDYFNSIPHDILLDNIRFSDPRDNQLFENYVHLFDSPAYVRQDGKGVGIGGEPSQVIAIVYLSSLERGVSCNCNVIGVGRYMDDSYSVCHTKEEAQQVLDYYIKETSRLGLILNEKRTSIHHMTGDSVVWLKKRTHVTKTGKIVMELSKQNVRDRSKLTKYQYKLIQQSRMPLETAFQSIQCWASYARPYDSHKQMIKLLREFGSIFNVPWDIMKRLLHKDSSKNWYKDCRDKYQLF